MADSMPFERLCLLFVKSLLDKAHAYAGEDLSKFQRSRLGEAMTADIRKLGDMVFPAARTPRISAAARHLADSMGADLRRETWHSQKKLDGYKTFTYEHLYPVREIRAALSRASTTSDAMHVLDRMLWVAWITKDEDKRLRELGFGSVREHPLQAYEAAGITLDPDEPTLVMPASAGPTRTEGRARADVGQEAHAPDQFRPGDRLPLYWQRGLLAMQTVSELHQRGYQRLRIVPGKSGSGFDWRCFLVPASHLSGRAGFTIDEDLLHAGLAGADLADNTTAALSIIIWGASDERGILGVPEADALTPAELADKIAQDHPRLLAASEGSDWAYAGWLLERLWDARNGLFPISYDNWMYSADFSDALHVWGPAIASGPTTRSLPPPAEGNAIPL